MVKFDNSKLEGEYKHMKDLPNEISYNTEKEEEFKPTSLSRMMTEFKLGPGMSEEQLNKKIETIVEEHQPGAPSAPPGTQMRGHHSKNYSMHGGHQKKTEIITEKNYMYESQVESLSEAGVRAYYLSTGIPLPPDDDSLDKETTLCILKLNGKFKLETAAMKKQHAQEMK
eukprot:UN22731